MLLSGILRWAAVAAIIAAKVRMPRPTAFESLAAGRPSVLARAMVGPGRFRSAAH